MRADVAPDGRARGGGRAGRSAAARRLALAALAALLFSLSLRPWGLGLAAVMAFVPLAAALDGERRLLPAAGLASLAWLGLGLPVFASTSLAVWWAAPVLVAVFGLGWGLAGASAARLARLTPLALPLAVTAFEHLAGSRFLLGDPATSVLAYTQADTPLRRLAAWTGPSGPALGAALLGCVLYWALRGRRRFAALSALALAVALALPVPGVNAAAVGGGLTVGVVQTAQSTLAHLLAPFSDEVADEHAARFDELTRRAALAGAELVVWGESTLPDTGGAPPPTAYRAALSRAAVTVAGGVEYGEDGLYNAVMAWYGPGLEVIGRKLSLVPVVEAPYARGRNAEPVMLQGAYVAPFVCLDSLHAGLSRDGVRRGAELLLYVTDDTFAGRTATPWYHLRTAVLRAVESGRAAVFANEAGPSALVGPTGELLRSSAAGEPAVIVATVPLMRGTTPFVALGDWLGPAASIVTTLLLVATLVGRRIVSDARR